MRIPRNGHIQALRGQRVMPIIPRARVAVEPIPPVEPSNVEDPIEDVASTEVIQTTSVAVVVDVPVDPPPVEPPPVEVPIGLSETAEMPAIEKPLADGETAPVKVDEPSTDAPKGNTSSKKKSAKAGN